MMQCTKISTDFILRKQLNTLILDGEIGKILSISLYVHIIFINYLSVRDKS